MGHEKVTQKQDNTALRPDAAKPVPKQENTAQPSLLQHYREIGNQAVLRLMEPGQSLAQRKPLCPECDEKEEDETQVQFKQSGNQAPQITTGIQSQIKSLRGGGQPLPLSTRSFFEPRFGQDLSQVRVHTDSTAAKAAKSINARAFTIGKHVAFGSGQYVPGTEPGNRLLAHELTHVMQQGAIPGNETVYRFGFKEHLMVGDKATGKKMIVLYPGGMGVPKYQLSFGEIQALGDYVGSEQKIKGLARAIKGQLRLNCILSIYGLRPEPPGCKALKKDINKEYYRLNGTNFEHFSETAAKDNNLKKYLKLHNRAIKMATDAGKPTIPAAKSNELYNDALRIEAFASHFLADAFTGGHVTAPREGAKNHWDTKYPEFISNFMEHLADHMAHHMNDNPVSTALLNASIMTVAYFKSRVLGMIYNQVPSYLKNYTLGGLISVAIHDWYNKHGLDVISQKGTGTKVAGGVRWKAYGEKTTLDQAVAKNQGDNVIAAVKTGYQHVEAAYNCKGNPACLSNLKSLFKVTPYVPRADRSMPRSDSNMNFKWRHKDINGLVGDKDIMRAIKALISPTGFIGKRLDNFGNKLQRRQGPGGFEVNPQAAFRSWLRRFRRHTVDVIKEIADYVPCGKAHHYSTDTMSRDYINRLWAKGKLTNLTTKQMIGLNKKMFRGATDNDDERAILKVLRAANKKGNVYAVVNGAGGFWQFEKEFQGKEWLTLLRVLTKKYFPSLSLKTKYNYIRWLVDETSREWGEEACIAILNACETWEFKPIVNTIGKSKLDSFLDGAEQRRFDYLLIHHGY